MSMKSGRFCALLLAASFLLAACALADPSASSEGLHPGQPDPTPDAASPAETPEPTPQAPSLSPPASPDPLPGNPTDGPPEEMGENRVPYENELRLDGDLPIYPPQEVSDTVAELVGMASGFDASDLAYMLRRKGDAQIHVGVAALLFYPFDPWLMTYCLPVEEVAMLWELGDEYHHEYFIETDVVDAHFYRLFSKEPKNIIPSYREWETVDDGRLVYHNSTGVEESFILVLKSQAIHDDRIELSFSVLCNSVDNLYDRGEWGAPIGWVEWEGDARTYVLDGDVMNDLKAGPIVITFILEDGTYKIHAIELG